MSSRSHVFQSALLLLPGLILPAAAQARPNVQGSPSYRGFHLPTTGGSLSYAVTLSGNVTNGYNGGSGTSGFTTVSGDLAYLTESKLHPFSLVYSGGYFANLTGNSQSSVFQNLALSQVLTRGRWSYTVADSVSYLPQSANSGFSGVPGVGDTGTAPVDVGTGTGLGVLTDNQSRVTNSVIGSAERRLTPSTSLSGTGSYTISRFLDGSSAGSALNSDQYTGGANLNHRIDARTSVGGGYSYFHIAYPGGTSLTTAVDLGGISAFSSNALTFNVSRLVTRRFSIFASAGPQWTSIPGTATAGTVVTTGTSAPGPGTSVNVAVNAGATYTAKVFTGSVTYSRGTNTGSGVTTGAQSDSLQATAGRRFGRVWNGSTSFSYNRSSSLVALLDSPFMSNTVVGTAQVNRSVGRHLSAYGSYTAQQQSFQGVAATSGVFSGLSQTIGAGITYSPGVIGHIRR